MKNNNLLYILIIVLIIYSSFITYITFFSKKVTLDQSRIIELQIKDSLETLNRQVLNKQLDSLFVQIDSLKNSKNKIKIKYVKEINNIYNLNADSSISYLSTRLSSKDSLE